MAMPRLRAAETPALAWRTTRTRASPRELGEPPAPPSVEPSSTTMTSMRRKVCASAERTAPSMNPALLYRGMTTENFMS